MNTRHMNTLQCLIKQFLKYGSVHNYRYWIKVITILPRQNWVLQMVLRLVHWTNDSLISLPEPRLPFIRPRIVHYWGLGIAGIESTWAGYFISNFTERISDIKDFRVSLLRLWATLIYISRLCMQYSCILIFQCGYGFNGMRIIDQKVLDSKFVQVSQLYVYSKFWVGNPKVYLHYPSGFGRIGRLQANRQHGSYKPGLPSSQTG